MTRHRRLCIARALFGMWFLLLAVLFVYLTLDRAMSQRLAAAEEEAVKTNREYTELYVQPETFDDEPLNHAQWVWNEAHDYAQDYCNNRNRDAGLEIAYYIFQTTYDTNIDPLLIIAIIETESNFNPHCRGRAGEYGLMQVHPCWVGNPAIGSPTVEELKTIEGNIRAGCAIFKLSYKDDYYRALGYYNGGNWCNNEYAAKVRRKYREIVEGFYHRLSGRRCNG